MKLTLFRSILFVKDMDSMFRFYRDIMGLEPVDDSADEWKVLAAGPVELALHAIPAPFRDEILISDPPQAREDEPIKLVFYVEDLEEAKATLQDRGVQFLENRFLNPPGEFVRCDLLDPEGNIVQLTNAR